MGSCFFLQDNWTVIIRLRCSVAALFTLDIRYRFETQRVEGPGMHGGGIGACWCSTRGVSPMPVHGGVEDIILSVLVVFELSVRTCMEEDV